MRRALTHAAAVGCILLLGSAGIASAATGPSMANEAGKLPANYQAAAKAYLVQLLPDPASARVELKKPELASCEMQGGKLNGWRVMATVNAKDLYGNDMAPQHSYLWFTGGELRYQSASPNDCP